MSRSALYILSLMPKCFLARQLLTVSMAATPTFDVCFEMVARYISSLTPLSLSYALPTRGLPILGKSPFLKVPLDFGTVSFYYLVLILLFIRTKHRIKAVCKNANISTMELKKQQITINTGFLKDSATERMLL